MKRVNKPSVQYLAEFRRFYGDTAYRSAFYPTRDHVISFREFWQFYECMAGVEARERINDFRSLANALSCLFAEKGAPMLPALRDDLVAAFLASPD